MLWFVFLAGFAVLSGFAAAYDRFPADLWLAQRLQEIDAAGFERALDWTEDVADIPWIIVVWLGGVAALFAAARRWEALLLLASVLARPLNAGVKELIDRPRPSEDLVAGMEGALPSVVAGLVAAPVIAVPTSVGYGASFGGLAPLLAMLNSCVAGVGVVNIDNGFGAGYLAAVINRQSREGLRE